MVDHDMRERKPPQHLGHEDNPIAVGDEVRVRDGKTSDYWKIVVKSIEGGDMMVQWVGDGRPGAHVYVPLGSVHGKGADGGYGDGSSALGGASSNMGGRQQSKRTKKEPKSYDWVLNEITRLYVMQETGADDDSSVVSRTMITVNSSMQRAGGKWVRQSSQEINLLIVLEDDTVRDLYLCTVLKFL